MEGRKLLKERTSPCHSQAAQDREKEGRGRNKRRITREILLHTNFTRICFE
jgi:hypothetical protein